MKKLGAVSALVAALLLVAAGPSYAWSRGHGHFHSRVVVGVGFGPWWGPPWWYYPYPYPYPYVYAPPPTVVVQEPPVYVQQQAAPAPAPESFWYYCPSSKSYYPYVQSCPEAWVKVPPRPQE
jgi:hypothetical protein